MTGWAQVHGLRGDTSIEDRVSFDNEYIESWSLWNDVKILIRTLPALTRGAG
jgi:lipopolysaccharide/colanic/teichoic acid biosynthesis glycosyltransferase